MLGTSYPNFKDKHKYRAVVNPDHFLRYESEQGRQPKFDVPKGIIFSYNSKLLKYIVDNHGAEKVDNFFGAGDLYLLKDTNKQIGVVANFGIGAPVAVALLEELIAFGVKKFISVGYAGTPQAHINPGDLIVCNRAIRDEGTSYHYLKPSKYAYASEKLTQIIKDTMEADNHKYIVGTSWTIDAPYRATVEEIKKYQKEEVVAIEMEAAALFSVAKVRGVEMGAMFTVSDSLADLKWDPKFHMSEESIKVLFHCAKEALMQQ